VDTQAKESRLERVVRCLQPLKPVKIVLFGSAARGQDDRLSDLDVVVVAEDVAPRFVDRIGDAIGLIDADFALDILVYTPAEYEGMLRQRNVLIETVEQEGRVLYERPGR
jgi:predicted nucleotidyltransferase